MNKEYKEYLSEYFKIIAFYWDAKIIFDKDNDKYFPIKKTEYKNIYEVLNYIPNKGYISDDVKSKELKELNKKYGTEKEFIILDKNNNIIESNLIYFRKSKFYFYDNIIDFFILNQDFLNMEYIFYKFFKNYDIDNIPFINDFNKSKFEEYKKYLKTLNKMFKYLEKIKNKNIKINDYYNISKKYESNIDIFGIHYCEIFNIKRQNIKDFKRLIKK